MDADAIAEFRLLTTSGIASPVNRTNQGFVGGGLTAGGAREWVVPSTAKFEIVAIRYLRR